MMMTCMNPVAKEISYANNSVLQSIIISKITPTLDDAIKDVFSKIVPISTFKAADLGCASGANTFTIVSQIIDSIYGICQQSRVELPEIQVFLNDLPENDFNSIFRSVPKFCERLKEKKGDRNVEPACFIVGVPGSYHGRVFPSRSLHFINSSTCLHWISKAPPELGKSNKGNICLAKSSSPDIFKAYAEQFQKDFSRFLSSRSEEVIPGGRMVLSFGGRNNPNPWNSEDCCFALFGTTIADLVVEGIIKEADLDSFNLPMYKPHKDEVRQIIEREGSFHIDQLQVFETDWDPTGDVNYKENSSGKYQGGGQILARAMRAATEQMVSAHFGDAIVERLFIKYEANVTKYLAQNKGKIVIILMSMSKT